MNIDKNKQEADRLIEAFFQGKLTTGEKVRLQKWLAIDIANKKYFRQMYLLWKGSALHDQDTEEPRRAFQKVVLQISRSNTIDFQEYKKSPASSILTLLKYWKYAAIIVLTLTCGAILYHVLFNSSYFLDRRSAKSEISVSLGSKCKIALPDGSQAWLNAGSKLTYGYDFGIKAREVDLVGEAYFNVTGNAGKPFIVHTSGADIRALGTEFNVKAYPDDDFISTILVKGSIEFSRIHASLKTEKAEGEAKRKLKPGQKVTIYKEPEGENSNFTIHSLQESSTGKPKSKIPDKNIIYMEDIDPMIETSWKEDKWIIKGKYLDELCVLLSRRYNISIILWNDELIKYRFSGTIQKETLEQVFDIMSLTVPVSYSIEKGQVIIDLDRNLEKKYKKAYKM